MKKYTALFAALTLVLALAGCGAETQTPMPGQSEQEEFTQNSTENVNETDGMTLLDSVFDTLSEGTDVTIPLDSGGRVRPARLCLRHPLHPHHGTAGDHRRLQGSPSGGAAAAGADPSQGVQQLLPPVGALRPGCLLRPLPQVRGLPPGKGLRHRQSRQTGLTALESLWNFTCLRNAQARFFVFPHILR